MTPKKNPVRVIPLDVVSEFRLDELFFSRTDKRGVIASGNDVFRRVSKFEIDELLNHPHNVIRHPDMPRAVFRLFWETIQAGNPIAAYVKNMARDGSYYWVMAYVVPVGDEYLSVRLKPTTDLFTLVESLYAEMRLIEKNVEDDVTSGTVSGRRDAAMDCSTHYMLEVLNGHGFESYEEFMRTALPAEVTARAAMLMRESSDQLPRVEPSISTSTDPLLAGFGALRQILDAFSKNLQTFAMLETIMTAKSHYLENLGEEIRLFALNAILACDGFGERASALAAVASLMRDRSNTIEVTVKRLIGQLCEFAETLGQINFLVTTSQLQNEQGDVFVRAVRDGHEATSETQRDVEMLALAQHNALQPLQRVLNTLDGEVSSLTVCVQSLQRELRVLQVLHVNGRVESSQIPNNAAIIALFQTIGDQVRRALTELSEFEALRSLSEQNFETLGKQIATQLEVIEQNIHTLTVEEAFTNRAIQELAGLPAT